MISGTIDQWPLLAKKFSSVSSDDNSKTMEIYAVCHAVALFHVLLPFSVYCSHGD